MEQMLDHHGICELEIVVFPFGFITILEQLEEAMGKLRRIQNLCKQAMGRGRGGVPPPRVSGLWESSLSRRLMTQRVGGLV